MLWPSIYIKDNNQLCVNTQHFVEFNGKNCYKNGESIYWTGLGLHTLPDGNSAGRDDTEYRIQNGIINNEKISYRVEWGRRGKWYTLARVDLNRLTGEGVDWFTNMHGG